MVRGCWTCKNRKIACDRGQPVCRKCVESNRFCLGYGLRLSWPRDEALKRSRRSGKLLEWDPMRGHSSRGEILFLNIIYDDMRLYYDLTNGKLLGTKLNQHLHLTSQPFSPATVDVQGAELIDIQHGSQLFNAARGAFELGDILAPLVMRIALSDASTASIAVRQSIFALSSLYLGRTNDAFTYKARAVSSLSRSANQITGVKPVFQHIAASMLLCLFEMSHTCSSSSDWGRYLGGIKMIIASTIAHRNISDYDCAMLIEWVYFHEVIAGFTILHWSLGHAKLDDCAGAPPRSILLHTQSGAIFHMSQTMHFLSDILEAISVMYTIISTPKASRTSNISIQRLTKELEHQLVSKTLQSVATPETSNETRAVAVNTAECYRKAALIYLNRAIIEVSNETPSHQKLLNEALVDLGSIRAADVPWPLFIIGCEAKSDPQRKALLRLLSSQPAEVNRINLSLIQQMIETYWKQEDLDADLQVDYITKLSAVVSSSHVPPFFV